VTARTAAGTFRIVAAAVCAVALVGRFIWGLGSATFTAGNFFAYLTIQSNIMFVVVSTIAGVAALQGPSDPRWLTNVRASVLTCTVTAGVVFALLIQQAGARGFRIDVPWSDWVLHFILPVLSIGEWLVSPGRTRAHWRTVLYAIGFTIVWGVFTLVRGPIVGWYPYFFLDPDQVSGPVEFITLCSIALSAFGALGALVVWLSRVEPLAMRMTRAQVLLAA
jgi:hypothetical protein